MRVAAAMIEGLERRFPGTEWVVHHGFEEGPLVVHLGNYREEVDEDDEDRRSDRTFAHLYFAARELEALRDLVALRLIREGQPIRQPEPPNDVGLLWSLHTALAEARYQVDPPAT